MTTTQTEIEDAPLNDLELAKFHCLACIQEFSGDVAARRILLRVNGEIARRKQVEKPVVLTPENLGWVEPFKGL